MAARGVGCMHTSGRNCDNDDGEDDDDDDQATMWLKQNILLLPSTGQRNDPVRPRRKNERIKKKTRKHTESVQNSSHAQRPESVFCRLRLLRIIITIIIIVVLRRAL